MNLVLNITDKKLSINKKSESERIIVTQKNFCNFHTRTGVETDPKRMNVKQREGRGEEKKTQACREECEVLRTRRTRMQEAEQQQE